MRWSMGKYSKGAVKMHTLIDSRGSIPVFIHITDGRFHDRNVLDLLNIIPGSIYTMGKAYVDFKALGLQRDCTIQPTSYKSSKLHSKDLRLIEYSDPDSGKLLHFVTNIIDCL